MAWDKNLPGNVKLRVGRQQILTNNDALETALSRDHNFPGTPAADDGEHFKITLHAPLADDPTEETDKGFLYLKDVSAKAELFFKDEDGHEIQLTTGGVINMAGVVFLAGAQNISGAKTFQATLTMSGANIAMSGANIVMAGAETVDGVDVSAHKEGTAKAQHDGGVGDHTHLSAGAEGGLTTLDALSPYDSGWFAVAADTTYTKAHGLGAIPRLVQVWISDSNPGTTILPGQQYNGGVNFQSEVISMTTENIVLRTAAKLAEYKNSSGVETLLTSGYARIIAIK